MQIAFGQVRRKSRIVADYTDYADFKGTCCQMNVSYTDIGIGRG